MKPLLLWLSISLVLSSLAMADPKPGGGHYKKRYATPEPGIAMLGLSLGTIAAGLALKKRLNH